MLHVSVLMTFKMPLIFNTQLLCGGSRMVHLMFSTVWVSSCMSVVITQNYLWFSWVVISNSFNRLKLLKLFFFIKISSSEMSYSSNKKHLKLNPFLFCCLRNLWRWLPVPISSLGTKDAVVLVLSFFAHSNWTICAVKLLVLQMRGHFGDTLQVDGRNTSLSFHIVFQKTLFPPMAKHEHRGHYSCSSACLSLWTCGFWCACYVSICFMS